MTSTAYQNLNRRMRDIEQLMQAHSALTQIRRARKVAEQAGGGLRQISQVVDKLVSPPGRGRRAEVDALNRAAMVLLSAHLQGYVEDLYSETAQCLLSNKVKDVEALIRHGRDSFSNPHANKIEQLFCSLGISRITDGISWQKARNRSIRKRLTEYVRIRNRIAHGIQEPVSKAKVEQFKRFASLFAEKFDEKVHDEIKSSIGRSPW